MLEKSYTNTALLFFRVSFSLCLMTHGYGKSMKLINGNFNFADPLRVGSIPSLISTVLGNLLHLFLLFLAIVLAWLQFFLLLLLEL